VEKAETVFRQEASKRERLRVILADPVFNEAIGLLRSRYRPKFTHVMSGADASLALALQQAYLTGANEFPDKLEQLGLPIDTVTPLPLVEWGLLHDVTKIYERTSTNNTDSTNNASSGISPGGTTAPGGTPGGTPGYNPGRKSARRSTG